MNKTNELELNRWAHELLGLCHAITTSTDWSKFDDEGICQDCGTVIEKHPDMPDYCSSLDLAAKVEAKAIELAGEEVYLEALKSCRTNKTGSKRWLMIRDVTAPALTRVQAAKRAVEGNGTKGE